MVIVLIACILILIAHLFYVNKTLRDDIRMMEDRLINDIVDIKLRLEMFPVQYNEEKNIASLIRKKRNK